MFMSVYTKGLWSILALLSIAFNKSNAKPPATSWRDLFFGSNWNQLLTQREAKFLPLFALATVGPTTCAAPSGEIGSCLPNKDCILRNGIPGGPCAGGYGVCCVCKYSKVLYGSWAEIYSPKILLAISYFYLLTSFVFLIVLQTCNGIIRENSTYFVNPNHPDIYDTSGNCQVTVQKLLPDICQLRLDFDIFTIAPPEAANHLCSQDQLVVSGGSPTPIICGTSPNDHMYIDAGLGQSNPIVISLLTSGTFPRLWRIRVTQIHCGSITRADQGCLQFFTGINGRVRSFNYNTISGRQLSNQDYSVCIRTERNFCGIQYTACVDMENNRSRSFTLSGNSNNPVGTMVGGGTVTTQNACINDWLLIGCIRNADRRPPLAACEDRVCGGTFAAEVGNVAHPVQSSVRPFRLYFHTDGIEAPTDIDNRGFCLDYVQQPCTTNV